MLVLSRRPEEKILLPTVPVLIKVISSNNGLVRLGFDAPADVPILREELTLGDAEASEEATGRTLHQQIASLTLAVTLLRIQLKDCEPLVRKTLDRLEEEIQGLRRTTRGSRREKVAV